MGSPKQARAESRSRKVLTSLRPHLAPLLGSGLFIITVIVSLVGWATLKSRDDARRSAEIAAANLCQILADNFSATIEKTDLGILAVLDEVARQQKMAGGGEAEITAAVAKQDTRRSDTLGFRIFGADGKLRYGIRNVADRNADISDRDDFKYLREHPDGNLLVSPPAVGATAHQWLILLGRRISNQDGSFGGAVYAPIPVLGLEKAFAALNIGPKGIILLTHGNFRIAAWVPLREGSDDPVGTDGISDNLRALIGSGVQTAQYEGISPIDGIKRTAHVRKVAGQPYYVIVALAEDDYLADWRRDTLGLILFGFLMVVLVTVGMLILNRRIIKQNRIETLLEARLRLANLAVSHSLRDLLVATLDDMCAMIDAEVGFYHFLVDDQTISLQAWSTRTTKEFCTASAEPGHYPLESAGIWADCVRQRRSVVYNDYPSVSDRRGLPDGHAEVRRLMSVPIFREGRIVAIIGFGNKPAPFRQDDVAAVENLADLVWDMTRRKQAEVALKHSEELLREAQVVTNLGYYVYDIATDRWESSDILDRIFGIGPDYRRDGRGWLALVSPEMRTEMATYLGALMASGHRFDREYPIRRADDGECRWVAGLGNIDRDGQGRATRMVGTIQDITERKRAEEALALRSRELAESNADLEQFAYVASHDLRTPLRNIVSYAQLLERRYKGRLDADADDFIGFIVDGSKRMSLLISDLLEFSRVSSQSDPLRPMPAREAVVQALANLNLDIRNFGATVSIADLPVVMADRTYLTSLFQNLLGNGVKYRAPDRQPVLSVTAERFDEDFWRFAVSDNGIGIDPAYHEKIFEIFQRLNPGCGTEGTGIGLTLCRRIVHRFGGTIGVESVPGAGTTFFFTIRDGGTAPSTAADFDAAT